MDKKLKVYFDNSVIGGYFDKEFEQPTKSLFKLIDEKKVSGYISPITLLEANAFINNPFKERFDELLSKLTLVELNDQIRLLARQYLVEAILTKKSTNDCLHVAATSFYGFEAIVSWNFKHLVNIDKIPKFNLINWKLGYKSVQICTPKDIINDFSK